MNNEHLSSQFILASLIRSMTQCQLLSGSFTKLNQTILSPVQRLQEEKQLVVEPLLHIFSKLVVQGLPRVLTAYEKHCDDKHVCLLLLPLGLFLNTIKAYLVHNSFEIVVFSAVIDAFLCLLSPLM